LAYLYFSVMSVYSEHSCDAILVQELDLERRKRYGEVIINMSQVGRWTKSAHQANLSTGKIMVEWRLKSMLRSRKSKKIEKMTVLIIRDGEKIVLRKRPGEGLLAGMYLKYHQMKKIQRSLLRRKYVFQKKRV